MDSIVHAYNKYWRRSRLSQLASTRVHFAERSGDIREPRLDYDVLDSDYGLRATSYTVHLTPTTSYPSRDHCMVAATCS
jgi:hypothetical protein